MQDKGVFIKLPSVIHKDGKTILPLGEGFLVYDYPDATFQELLLKNLMRILGEEWWNEESNKSQDKKHIIKQCFEDAALPGRGEGHLPSGFTQSLLTLAFDVYLLQMTNSLSREWLRRLKRFDQYQGVRYEIAVASIFARIDCKLDILNDKEVKSKHPEFYATLKQTGDKVAVEAKSRHRNGIIHQPGKPDLYKAMKGDVARLLHEAFKKDSGGLPFIIFIDVNSPVILSKRTAENRWYSDIRKIVDAERQPMSPFNLLAVTSYSTHYEENHMAVKAGQSAFVIPLQTTRSANNAPSDQMTNRIVTATANYGFIPN